jgi:branched-chain amino acid transport system ATP-binding protein
MAEIGNIMEVEDIHTYYGDSHVIQGLSLFVREREAVSILGRNGVGKTTTLRAVMGLTPPRRGTVRIRGHETTGWAPHRVSRLGVAYVPAERHIFPGLSVEENLKLAERPGNTSETWTLERIYEQFPVLADRRKQDGSTMSGGEQQMLAIGRALVANPGLIILDEPSQGLSPLLVENITEIVINFCVQSHIALLVVEQNYRMALKVAKRHYLMGTKGLIAGETTTEELTERPEIIEEHLAV